MPATTQPTTQPALAPFALPLDVHPLGLYYNRKLFRQAGIVDAAGNPAPPTTRDEFLSALRKLKQTQTPTDQPPYQQWGFVFTWQRTNFWALLHQFNGRAFTPDYSACTLSDPGTVAALDFCADLVHREKLVPSPQNIDAWIGFRQGKVGMAFEGIYMLPDLQKQKDLDFAGAPLPVLGDRPATWASSHNLCLRADLKDEELAAAWRFIRFLSDHSLDWAEGGQVPVRRSLRNTSRFANMTVQAQFARQIPYVCYPPRIPFSFEFFTEFDLAIERALRGTATPAAALSTATQKINTIMAEDRAIHPDEGGAP